MKKHLLAVLILISIIMVSLFKSITDLYVSDNVSNLSDLYVSKSLLKTNSPCNCSRPLPPRGNDFSKALMNGTIPPDGSYVGPSSCNLYTDHLGSSQDVLNYSYYIPHTINIFEDRHCRGGKICMRCTWCVWTFFLGLRTF